MTKLTLSSPAKINLFLEITRRRDDGYHEIDTFMQELSLADTITLEAHDGPELTLACDMPGIPVDASNLMMKAAALFRREAHLSSGVHMTLKKCIPAGGGMGGGSSNAAITLRGLNRLHQQPLSPSTLMKLAAQVGSDVAFFLEGGTARCTGRGEIITPQSPCPRMHVVLIFPEWGISTPAAYRALDPATFAQYDGKRFADALRSDNIAMIAQAGFNRFEEAVFGMEPREKALFEILSTWPFLTVRMSGSGSTLFGIANSEREANILAEKASALAGVRQAVVAQTISSKRNA